MKLRLAKLGNSVVSQNKKEGNYVQALKGIRTI